MAEKENFPPPKKRRLSLKLNRNRFKKATEEDVSDAMKGFVLLGAINGLSITLNHGGPASAMKSFQKTYCLLMTRNCFVIASVDSC